jgi:transposase-like protein
LPLLFYRQIILVTDRQEVVMAQDVAVRQDGSLDWFACPNPDCYMFNRFAAGNLSVVERNGKGKAIRRLYCNHCQQRFSERKGSLMQQTHLPRETVVRVIKCLTYGCSEEATADICEVDVRSVERLRDRGGTRAEDFHQLQLEKLDRPPEIVEVDELHGKVARPPQGKKGGAKPASSARLSRAVRRAVTGFTWPWR